MTEINNLRESPARERKQARRCRLKNADLISTYFQLFDGLEFSLTAIFTCRSIPPPQCLFRSARQIFSYAMLHIWETSEAHLCTFKFRKTTFSITWKDSSEPEKGRRRHEEIVACVSSAQRGILRRHKIRSWEKYFLHGSVSRCNWKWRRQPRMCYVICLLIVAVEMSYVISKWFEKREQNRNLSESRK